MISSRLVKYGMTAMLSIFLAGCTVTGGSVGAEAQPETPPNSVALYLKHHKVDASNLSKYNVAVIQRGDEILLILSADRFFYPCSSNYRLDTLPALTSIVALLNNYEVVDVKIAGYTDNVGLPERNMALSREWAQIITNQLWANGLDARVVYATGYGDLDPIGDNETPVNRAVNRRIEITLKLPPAPYVW